MLIVHVFVCFARVSFCPFSLPLGVRGWLRFVIVTLPGLFINFDKHNLVLISKTDLNNFFLYQENYFDSN